jgi:hypothetical protein
MASALAYADEGASLTDRFCATVKAYGFSGYGDTGYWSRRIKELALITTEYLTGIAFSCSATVNAALADERRQIIDHAREYAFKGYGDSDYWSARCKDFADTLMRAGRRLERHIAKLDARKVHPLKQAALDRRIMNFVSIARHYAVRGHGDTDFWSLRTKALALEVGIFVSKVAASLGMRASDEMRQNVQRLLASAKAYAYTGYGDAEYWRERCEQLCTLSCETSLQLAVHS